MSSPYSNTNLAILDDALLSIGVASGVVAAKNATNLEGSPM
jgi:hypothetical protein